MGNRIRLVGIAILATGLVLAGASTATFAQDEAEATEANNEAEVIGAFISEKFNADWSTFEESDWLSIEAELIGLAEDTTHVLCHDYALRGAAFFRGIADNNTVSRAGAWAIWETLDSSRNACYWAEGSLS